ncbi:helix-turn-helix domain-containing protein [Cnuibacter sp. UC19_7]|uniref:helix-turn-helix domain-containing protein n=1 Tax=Cnuibacter sp. UC19_7 TaxID=3350166 RepID=UPI00366FA6C9
MTEFPPHIADADRTFAENVKRARLAMGLKQDQLAAVIDTRGLAMHPTTIGKIERGERRVSIGEAAALADILGVALADLLEGTGELQVAYTAHTRAQKRLVSASYEYAMALLEVAAAADGTVQLEERDRGWLDTELHNQSPARMTTDVLYAVRAAVDRREIDESPGTYVSVLLGVLEADLRLLLNRHGND